MHTIPQFILASQSPRRKMLLEWAELDFEVIVRSTDEQFPHALAMPDVPVYIAREKANAVKASLFDNDHRLVLAADTIVVLGDQVIGKPTDRDNAIDILNQLSGNEHQVITGVVMLWQGREYAFSDTTRVRFHELTHEQLAFYVDKYKPYDKAGAYAIQEWIGVVGIQRIEGDFYNVMGLPVSRILQVFQQLFPH